MLERRARLYARVSTDEQSRSGYSLAAQDEKMRAFCSIHDWIVAGVYVEEGVSAKNLDRPKYKQMMSEAQTGDVIVVYKLDRLTRSVRDLDDLLKEFENRGLSFSSVTENFETTSATGRLMMRMIAEFAQWERETIAERSTFGKRKKLQMGEWGGGCVPFGYRGVPSQRVKNGRTLLDLVPDLERAHIVPMIFERYLAGQGIRSIAMWLNNELGVVSQYGKKFHNLTISRILTNPIYCGDVHRGRRLKKTAVERVEGSHEALVSREIFERVQVTFKERKLEAPRQATGQYPLAGVARCGVCGARIDAMMRGGRSIGYIYRCHNASIGVGCMLKQIGGKIAEELVLREIENSVQMPTDIDAFVADAQQVMSERAGFDRAEAERLHHDLSETEAAVGRWKRLFERGKLDEDGYLAEVEPHLALVKTIKARLDEYETKKAPLPSREALSVLTLNMRDMWDEFTPPERRAWLRQFAALGIHFLLYPGQSAELRYSPDGVRSLVVDR